jgi:hypothetical protein
MVYLMTLSSSDKNILDDKVGRNVAGRSRDLI